MLAIGVGAGFCGVVTAVRVAVADRRTLNSGGILPLALGIPAFLGLLAFSVKVKREH